MTPIRNDFLAKISDSLTANQISNGVYPVRPHLKAGGCLLAPENVINFNVKLIMMMKAEV
ncbi:hypothetical protein A3F65_01905 [Candidatus Saccharibacteria bacterium RIFCSPHIGHO2_12_FULL_47_16b]|nr:MAG: hypothetical protein A3F65_01905 [Candidatus Saccharibacteria bacterium RIFCSPHIGHO2_12_FULL_47_16b]OGL40213.1 MAG: hypothetical protein A3J32_01805 [Candidatus Saccharibacteria bacterium RIFCSPLOWO2_02_FULL_46_7]